MTNLASFGPIELYRSLIMLVNRNNDHWRKVPSLINQVRRQMHPWQHIDKEGQFASAREYVIQALKDTKLPDNVKAAVKEGLALEFGFNFE